MIELKTIQAYNPVEFDAKFNAATKDEYHVVTYQLFHNPTAEGGYITYVALMAKHICDDKCEVGTCVVKTKGALAPKPFISGISKPEDWGN